MFYDQDLWGQLFHSYYSGSECPCLSNLLHLVLLSVSTRNKRTSQAPACCHAGLGITVPAGLRSRRTGGGHQEWEWEGGGVGTLWCREWPLGLFQSRVSEEMDWRSSVIIFFWKEITTFRCFLSSSFLITSQFTQFLHLHLPLPWPTIMATSMLS